MCIVCDCDGIDGKNVGSDYLTAFDASRHAMQKATDAMLKCAKVNKKYDATHKAMVKLMKEWNRLEETRGKCDG